MQGEGEVGHQFRAGDEEDYEEGSVSGGEAPGGGLVVSGGGSGTETHRTRKVKVNNNKKTPKTKKGKAK